MGTMNHNDGDLWSRSLTNDGVAFGVLFDRHRDRVYRHAYRLAQNAAELNEASGRTASTEFTSPSDAQAWQEARQGTVALIPVYESDGETVIGEFEAGRW